MTNVEWTEKEIKRFNMRAYKMVEIGAYQAKNGDWIQGISTTEAEYVAQQMLYRDRPGSGDDRRICLECQWLDVRKCRKLRLEPVRIVMQRCDGFSIRGG
jgi:hypothetical protein